VQVQPRTISLPKLHIPVPSELLGPLFEFLHTMMGQRGGNPFASLILSFGRKSVSPWKRVYSAHPSSVTHRTPSFHFLRPAPQRTVPSTHGKKSPQSIGEARFRSFSGLPPFRSRHLPMSKGSSSLQASRQGATSRLNCRFTNADQDLPSCHRLHFDCSFDKEGRNACSTP